MKSRQQAIHRSQIAKQAKPLGELIIKASKMKQQGVDDPLLNMTPPLPPPRKKRKRTKTRTHPETQLVHDCLVWLKEHKIFAFRQNTGTLWVGNCPISYGLKGAGDITGLLPNGLRLEIECKVGYNKQSQVQKDFQTKIEKNKGIYLLVYSVEELAEALGGWA